MAAGCDDREKRVPGLSLFLRNILNLIFCKKSLIRGLQQRNHRESPRASYLTVRCVEIARASGFFGVQSSGGKDTRQNVGHGFENSNPISALPPRTGPRNATWHSCSSSVLLCFI